MRDPKRRSRTTLAPEWRGDLSDLPDEDHVARQCPATVLLADLPADRSRRWLDERYRVLGPGRVSARRCFVRRSARSSVPRAAGSPTPTRRRAWCAAGATRACGASRGPCAACSGAGASSTSSRGLHRPLRGDPDLRPPRRAPAAVASSTSSRRASRPCVLWARRVRCPGRSAAGGPCSRRSISHGGAAAHPVQRAVDPPGRAGRRRALRALTPRHHIHRRRRLRLPGLQPARSPSHDRRVGLDLRPARRDGGVRPEARRHVRRNDPAAVRAVGATSCSCSAS